MWGDPQWHAGVDPASVETQAGRRGNKESFTTWGETCYAAKAVYSVACLESGGALLRNNVSGRLAKRTKRSPQETRVAKEDRNRKVLSGKTPRLYRNAGAFRGILEIIVWS